MTAAIPMVNSVFIGSFNMNNADLSSEDAQLLLSDSNDADLVVMAFQECGSCPDEPVPSPSSLPNQQQYCRKSQEAHGRNVLLLDTLHDALGGKYSIIADVAMGESATGEKVVVGKEKVEWYGYIRLIVFSKKEVAPKLQPLCKTVICPAGSKTSVDSISTILPGYADGQSPDKGAVCVALGNDLLLVNLHLHGTNKYNVPESVFDEIRIQQLDKIGATCSRELEWRHCIIAGDFNFRCEVFSSEKSRGGKDFQAVHDMVTSGNEESIANLFFTNDRLLQLLRLQSTKNDFPFLLKTVQDSFCHGFETNGCILPTFTFAGEGDKRAYSDKRTPSWTDRVLLSSELLQGGFGVDSVGTIPDIVASDHIPVFCRISKQGSL